MPKASLASPETGPWRTSTTSTVPGVAAGDGPDGSKPGFVRPFLRARLVSRVRVPEKPMFRPSLLSVSILAAFAAPASALDIVEQPDVVVTASGVSQTVDSVLADVSIITRQDIDASVARDTSDLLRLQAGVDIARTGGPGSQTSVFLRGTNSNHVLVLVDGVRAAALGTGAFTWETLPLDTIERIEIVRGPRASYWGSDAIGGVIQIFTRKLDGARVSLGYGSDNDRKATAGYGARGDAGGFAVQFGWRATDGFPSQNENGFGYEPKDHGFENHYATISGDARVGTQTLSGSITRSEGDVEFAGGDSSFTQQVISGVLEGALGAQWQHRLQLGNTREDYETPAYFSLYRSRRDSIGWRHDVAIADNQRIVAGVDHVREEGDNRGSYVEKRDNTGLHLGWIGSFGAIDTDLAVRHDDNSEFGTATTGSGALGWRFGDAARAYASYGQGFRAPTLNEQFSPGFGGFYAGNPALDPEKSRNAEVGVEFTPAEGQRFKVNVFSNRVRNLISFTGVDFQAENVARAKIRGSELAYDGRFGDWNLGATFTWQDPRNEDTDTLLLRRAKQKASVVADYRLGEAGTVGAEVLYAGTRDDVGGIGLPSYTLLNLRTSWRLAADWTLAARVENATDRDYELAYGYNTPGRTGFVEVTWSPAK